MNWNYENGRIYSVDDNGRTLAEATYYGTSKDVINIDHVYVHPSLRGQGVANEVMVTVTDFLRKEGLKATATCSYAGAWFMRNKKECEDVCVNKMGEQVIACKIDGKH